MALSIHHDEDSDGHLRRRFGVLALVISICFALLLGRLFWLQIVEGDAYRERARTSFTKTEVIPARRGLIRDRTGEVLAQNQAVHRLSVLPYALEKAPVREATLDRLSEILELTHDERAVIEKEIDLAFAEERTWTPVVVDPHLVSDHCPFDGAELDLPSGEPPRDADAKHQLFCKQCGLHHEPISPDATYCPHDKAKLEWMGEDARHASCPKCKRAYVTSPVCPADGTWLVATDKNLLCPICKRRFTDEVAVLKTQMHSLPGLVIDTDFMREYTRPSEFAHPLGYMNKVKREERQAHPGVYALDARVGRSGVEKALEPILRGEAGFAKFLKGTDRSVPLDFQYAQPGQDVWLTIDARLQRAVRDILRYQHSAAAVVLDPQTGDVLAMYSHPGYDPNQWSGRLSSEDWQLVKENPYDPLHNKAVTAYAPGSVFKIVTALAALREGVLTSEDTILCKGFYEYGGRAFGCHAKNGHGYVDLVHAIKGSCDVYFYRAAEMIGMDKLAEYAREFGFGGPTGIEIAESLGVVPTRKWLEESPLGFQPGLTLSAGIGQGQVTATPLQVARAFAVIANGGRLVQPHIVSQYTDEHSQVLQKFLPVDERRVVMTDAQLQVIRDGLFGVVNHADGTAHNVFDPDLPFAGKTGTAEAAQTRPGADPELKRWLEEDHAWFSLYAPAPPAEPQVVITVFVEHGGAGSKDAAPLAKRILDAWKRLGLYRAPPEPPEGEEPSEEGHEGHDHGALEDGVAPRVAPRSPAPAGVPR